MFMLVFGITIPLAAASNSHTVNFHWDGEVTLCNDNGNAAVKFRDDLKVIPSEDDNAPSPPKRGFWSRFFYNKGNPPHVVEIAETERVLLGVSSGYSSNLSAVGGSYYQLESIKKLVPSAFCYYLIAIEKETSKRGIQGGYDLINAGPSEYRGGEEHKWILPWDFESFSKRNASWNLKDNTVHFLFACTDASGGEVKWVISEDVSRYSFSVCRLLLLIFSGIALIGSIILAVVCCGGFLDQEEDSTAPAKADDVELSPGEPVSPVKDDDELLV